MTKIKEVVPYLGAIEDPKDDRDLVYEDFIVGKARPAGMPSFEVGYCAEKVIGKLRDEHQDESYRCVSEGGTADNELSILSITGQRVNLSQRDAYSQIFSPSGGANPRDFYKLSKNVGVCEDRFCSSYPANGSRVSEAWTRQRGNITQERIDNALKWRTGAYRSIISMDLEVMARAIFENNGCGGAYRPKDGRMGHMIFFNGFGIYKGYPGLKYRDSYAPYEKWIIKKDGKFYYATETNPTAFEIQMYSIWTAESGDWVKKKPTQVDLEKLNIISNELLIEDASEDLKKSYLKDGQPAYDKDFVRKEIGKSPQRWQIIRGVNWLRKWKVLNLFGKEKIN